VRSLERQKTLHAQQRFRWAVYPKLKGKYAEGALFSASDSMKYHRKFLSGRASPETIILCYSPRLCESIQKAHKVSEVREMLGNVGSLYAIEGTQNKVGLLAQFGVGAPATVLHQEELASWGTKRFVILGMAGAINGKLKIGDIVVCSKSIRDEGTSHHYLKHSKYAFPSKNLTERLYGQIVSDYGEAYLGPSWTIDAPYRETIKEPVQYRNEGVLTVEMEASALFAVGKVRGLETAGVFVVSDKLSERKWKPAFRKDLVLENLLKAFKSIKNVLNQTQVA
jgi:uridine phosphorylase